MECLLQRQAVISLWRREAYHLHRPHRHHRHTYQWTTMQFLTCRLTAVPTTQRPTTSSARWNGRVSSPRRLWSPRSSSSRCQSFSSSLCVLVCTDKVLPQSFCASGSHATVTHTHTPVWRPFFQYQKGKEARDSEWQWHQLGHMQVCISLQTDNHASAPPLVFLQAGCPSCLPTNSFKALKAVSQSRKLIDVRFDVRELTKSWGLADSPIQQ